MKTDSLDELKTAFEEWRGNKRHAREAVPEALLARARRLIRRHGATAVVKATRLEKARLLRVQLGGTAGRASKRRGRRAAPEVSRGAPRFSRLELTAPSASGAGALAEVETGTGVKFRIFAETPELLRLMSSVCGLGGER